MARKELRSSFRDRQTAIYSVVLPICLYPALFWLMIQGAMLVQGRREHTMVRVGVAHAPGIEVPAGLVDALVAPPRAADEAGGEDAPAEPAPAEPQAVELERVEVALLGVFPDAESAWGEWTARADEDRDALLYLAEDAQGASASVLAYDSSQGRSSLARRRVQPRVEAFAHALRVELARARGADPRSLEPLRVEERNLAPDEEMGAYVLSMLLPLLLVVMAVMGAFFPAVDLTAGERERGTLETTMILPVPRLAVHQGKIVAVCVSALVATSLNLLALGLSAGHLLEMISAGAALEIELPLLAFAAIAPLALLFAFSVSAVLTGIAALAKTFKEGQALLGPVQLVFLVPAMAAAMPGLELTPVTAFVPVVNVVLAFRSILRGEVLPLEYTLTALSLCGYALLAIAFAVRVLSRESLSVAAETIPLRSLVRYLRSERGAR
ncbi:MAG: ABC transporter permease [Planctomycetes bacterium]|nr:ABC transporter permease [Planctomycetota bacterium]